MTLHNFIFTNRTPSRFYRHIAFWLGRLLFSMFSFAYFTDKSVRNWTVLFTELEFNAVNLFLAIMYSYIVVYYIYPAYLEKRKYLQSSIGFLILTIGIYTLYYQFVYDFNQLQNQTRDARIVDIWHFSVYFFMAGPPVVSCLFLLIKMLKKYYFQMEKKAILARENASAELQYLKAQVHPHFLFNTLNNIYSFMLDRSPKAKEMMVRLSGNLKYMINDCEAASVPLEKELKMMKDYIGLEKARYGERLDLRVSITGDLRNRYVAPLLMIPFIENSFKHGASRSLERPWIKLNIAIQHDTLVFEIKNSKSISDGTGDSKGGIGLTNVKKRLQLLYPDGYILSIEPADNTYSVYMQVPLQESNTTSVPVPIPQLSLIK